MAGFKATSLFLSGTLAGVGAAGMVVGALLPHSAVQLLQFGSVHTVLAGVWLAAIGLVGGIELARGRRTRRLWTALAAIAMLAVLLGVTVGVRRRAERLAGLATHYLEQGQRIADQSGDLSGRGPGSERAMALLRLVHWHERMWIRFNRASARPWLPVPLYEPCSCPTCSGLSP
jgi:hypothetical protein